MRSSSIENTRVRESESLEIIGRDMISHKKSPYYKGKLINKTG